MKTASGEDEARAQDAADPLASLRREFHVPRGLGDEQAYLLGNSLGLEPIAARAYVEQELDDWARLAARGHYEARSPWYPYHAQFREPLARLVGALPHEVVAMNSLTTNLHLLLVSFFRPTRERSKILIDLPCFPSDLYAVTSQLGFHELAPREHLLSVAPPAGRDTVDWEQFETTLAREGERVAVVLCAGVNFFTGQRLDMARLTALAHRHGALVGLDLAHAAGNVPLALHDWQVDFAVWCSYKYLNAGPGAVGGAFVHERHARDTNLPRFAGWWGTDPETRFTMPDTFVPVASADAWQLSNPPVLALAPLKASLALFERAGMPALRAKSERLTAYLERLLCERAPGVEILTPRDPEARGAQLSLRVRDPEAVMARLQAGGVVCDLRRPNVIRAAPVALYNSFHDVWRLAQALSP